MTDGADGMCAGYGGARQHFDQFGSGCSGGARDIRQVECVERTRQCPGDLWTARDVGGEFLDEPAEHLEVVDQCCYLGVRHAEFGTLERVQRLGCERSRIAER